jgi:hypothetical protein
MNNNVNGGFIELKGCKFKRYKDATFGKKNEKVMQLLEEKVAI